MRQWRNSVKAMMALAMAVAPLLGLSGAARAADLAGSCTSVALPVALAAGRSADQRIAGTLCNPSSWAGAQHTVDVLVHGATYNSSYWNWPIETAQYSYVNQTLQAGRATFAYDMLGAGASSRPFGATVTVDTEAFVLHQVLDWLRGQQAYDKFEVIGHSFGSTVSIDEAATYHDEDALVITAYSHALNPVHAVLTTADFYPADLDPQLASQGFDPGYLTTTPGARQTMFYGGNTDPAIIASDEAHKDVVPTTAFFTGLAQIQEPALINISNGITAPVLEMIGQQDYLVCGTGALVNCASPASVRAYDAPYFTRAASFSVQTIANTGHNLALHPTNTTSFAAINSWLQTH